MTLRVVIEQDGRRLGSLFLDGSDVRIAAANDATADRFLETLGDVFNALHGRDCAKSLQNARRSTRMPLGGAK